MKELFKVLSLGEPAWSIAKQLDPARLPGHVAIIMDGNGRWAGQRSLPRLMGHKAGVNAVRTVVETSAQLGLGALTLYAFSIENWKRPHSEVEGLWRLLRYYLRRELPELMRNQIRLVAAGQLDSLPAAVYRELLDAVAKTEGNSGLRLILAINYSGRTELVDAVNSILRAARVRGDIDSLKVSEQTISDHLYTAGIKDPDLLIRTSGEMRISNFLLWQIAYSELYVTETLWPDFNRTHFLRAILEYQNRDRRFGGLAHRAAGGLARSISAEENAAVELRLA